MYSDRETDPDVCDDVTHIGIDLGIWNCRYTAYSNSLILPGSYSGDDFLDSKILFNVWLISKQFISPSIMFSITLRANGSFRRVFHQQLN